MRSYYYDNLPGDVRLPHDSGKAVDQAQLEGLGIRHWTVPLDDWEPRVDALAAKENFKCQDKINVTKESFGEKYDDILKDFFDEHLHEEDEIRFVVSGGGYYDVREHPTDAWIRIQIIPGDLIAVPRGIYHRFMLDEQNAIFGLRLWEDVPNWAPVRRDDTTDTHPTRLTYLDEIRSGAGRVEGLFTWLARTVGNAILLK